MEHSDMINKLVDDIIDGNNSDARDAFDDLLSHKVTSALDQRKIDLAQEVFNQEEQEEETEE